MKPFKIEITEVEKGPKELRLQLPVKAEAFKQLPGKDRSDYFLTRLDKPILWIEKEFKKEVELVVICAKFKGQSVSNDMNNITIAVAYVVDDTIENDAVLSFKKCKYVAVAKASASGKWGIFS